MQALTLFGLFFIMLLISVPIGYSIGIATVITLLIHSNIPMLMIAQNSIMGVNSFPLMAIPFFILAGGIMSTGGVAYRIVKAANTVFGRFTGGLGSVAIASCMFFAAISGSAMATVAAIGGMLIPSMTETGYDKKYSSSLIAAAGTIGVIIPPSVPFVLYAVVVGTSVTELFIAGLIPGIAMGIALMIVNYFWTKKLGYTKELSSSRKEEKFLETDHIERHEMLNTVLALLTPVIILGGIYSGFFTPTEAAVVGCVYATAISVFVYKECSFKELYKQLVDTMNTNGLTMFMVGLSSAFAAYLTMEQIPQIIANSLLGITSNKITLLLLINLFLLVVGCFIDNIPATIILSPILLPIIVNLGMSPTQFGVILVMNLAIGFVTPPYGINLFVASAISNLKMQDLIKYILWFIGALLVVLMITTYFEPFTMGLVKLLSK